MISLSLFVSIHVATNHALLNTLLGWLGGL
jgi:hypothetical protein